MAMIKNTQALDLERLNDYIRLLEDPEKIAQDRQRIKEDPDSMVIVFSGTLPGPDRLLSIYDRHQKLLVSVLKHLQGDLFEEPANTYVIASMLTHLNICLGMASKTPSSYDTITQAVRTAHEKLTELRVNRGMHNLIDFMKDVLNRAKKGKPPGSPEDRESEG